MNNSKLFVGGLFAAACLAGFLGGAVSSQAAEVKFDALGDVISQAGKGKPSLPDGGLGFGGPVTGITSCVCKDLGVLIRIAGPYGGKYLFSFTSRPKLSVGSYFKSGGFVLGGAKKTGAKCGVFVAGDCEGETADGTITMIGGIVQ